MVIQIPGGLLYLNMLLDYRGGFNNITMQIQNLTSDLNSTKEEIFGQIKVVYILCIFWVNFRGLFNPTLIDRVNELMTNNIRFTYNCHTFLESSNHL